MNKRIRSPEKQSQQLERELANLNRKFSGRWIKGGNRKFRGKRNQRREEPENLGIEFERDEFDRQFRAFCAVLQRERERERADLLSKSLTERGLQSVMQTLMLAMNREGNREYKSRFRNKAQLTPLKLWNRIVFASNVSICKRLVAVSRRLTWTGGWRVGSSPHYRVWCRNWNCTPICWDPTKQRERERSCFRNANNGIHLEKRTCLDTVE